MVAQQKGALAQVDDELGDVHGGLAAGGLAGWRLAVGAVMAMMAVMVGDASHGQAGTSNHVVTPRWRPPKLFGALALATTTLALNSACPIP